MNNKKSGLFVIILLLIVVVLVLFFPMINKFIEKAKMPKIEQAKTEEKEKLPEIDEEVLSELHQPLMRNSVYNVDSYYKLDKFTISNMSNQDILYNAFLDIEPVTFASVGPYNCTPDSKTFDTKKMNLRIKNILGKNVNYNNETFYVPEGSSSSYVGEWTFDAASSRYIYSGLCQANQYVDKYVDVKQFIKAEYDNYDIITYYYIGFAKISGESYTIYKDANYTSELTSGTYTNDEDLNKAFEDVKDKNKNIYKSVYKNTLCSYSEYCLSSSEWIDKI